MTSPSTSRKPPPDTLRPHASDAVDTCPECGAPSPRPPACAQCGTPLVTPVETPIVTAPVPDAPWTTAVHATVVYLLVLLFIRASALVPAMSPDLRHGLSAFGATIVLGAVLVALLVRRSATALKWITVLATFGPMVSGLGTFAMVIAGKLAGWGLARAVAGVLAAAVWGMALRRSRRVLVG